jgi:hypothetical protein
MFIANIKAPHWRRSEQRKEPVCNGTGWFPLLRIAPDLVYAEL